MLNISEEVLSILVDNNLDYKSIVKKLAIHYPEVLMRIMHMDDLIFQVQDSINKAYDEDFPGNMKVTAIKKYRELSGTSLKDAKNAVEQMIANNQLIFHVKKKEDD